MALNESARYDPEVGNRFLRTVCVVVFLLFFQTFMVAPLIPSLTETFGRTREAVGLLVPAYTLPYALSALVYGILADRYGRRGLLFVSFAAFPVLGLAMATASGLDGLLALRALSGWMNSGIMVIGLSLVGDLFPPNGRGRAIGWVFGSVAGGGAFGSTVGAMLAPTVGWRGLFVLVAAAGALALLNARPLWGHLAGLGKTEAQGLAGYLALLRTRRGFRTYAAIALNGAFHSGVFTWLGTRLHDRYDLGEVGIGLALLGYGIPGLLLGPVIGRVVDRYGRRRLIPAGLAVAAVAAAMLVPAWPLAVAVGASTVLSLGFDMTQPLFAGIATTLDDRRRGQAMGLNACVLFLGYGLGSLVFGALARHGMSQAFLTFALVQGAFALIAVALFRNE